MPSSSFVRAALAGAGLVLAVLLAVAVYRYLTPEPPPPAADFDPSAFVRSGPALDAPFVTTDYAVVDAMLAMAEVRPGDQVIDLGSGDGRILIAAARSHGARGLGVDIDPARIREATANAQAARVADRVQSRRQDLFRTPLNEADVVTLYLTAEVNRRLRPRILEQMQPGTRVVSHQYDMGEWRPDQRQQIGASTIFLWLVPARVEGKWTINAEGRTATVDLTQSFQQVDGRVEGGGRVEQGRLAGTQIRFLANLGDGRREFIGRVNGDRIESTQPRFGWRAVRAG
jgi:protein-L-isoaspartate O-methyltransferase